MDTDDVGDCDNEEDKDTNGAMVTDDNQYGTSPFVSVPKSGGNNLG